MYDGSASLLNVEQDSFIDDSLVNIDWVHYDDASLADSVGVDVNECEDEASSHVRENCCRCNVDVYGNDIPNILIEVRSTVGMSFKNKKLSLIPENPPRSEVLVCAECYNTLMGMEEGMP